MGVQFEWRSVCSAAQRNEAVNGRRSPDGVCRNQRSRIRLARFRRLRRCRDESECHSEYLVVECTTMSNPIEAALHPRSHCCRHGRIFSGRGLISAECCQIASFSSGSRIHQTMRVSSAQSGGKLRGSVMSTNVNDRPHCAA